MRSVGRVAAIGSLLLAAVFTLAWAHAALVRSDPASSAHLSRPPAELELEFSEAVAPRTSRVELVTPDSQRLALVLRGDSARAKTLFAAVPSLAVTGRYRVEWRLVGPDGHAVTGQYAFTIDSIPVSPVDSATIVASPAGQDAVHEPSGDSLLQQAIRFLSFLSMVVVIGSVAFALFVLPAATRSAGDASADFGRLVDRRLRTLSSIGAWSLLILAVVRLTSHGVVLSGSLQALQFGDLADLVMGSTFGRGWLLQVAAVIALLFGLRSARPMRWGALAGFTGALAISASFLGHPAAVPDVPGLAMSLDALHVLAAGGWVGAIIVLAVAALPQVRTVPSANRVEVVRGLLRAFSPLALRCAAILAVTGAIGGWLQLRDPGLILGSDYGLVLFRKVVLVVMIAALGAYHWRVVQPSVGSDRSVGRLRGSLVLDVALVLVVLVLTAILTGTAPPVR
jgi:putative copper export protein/methionine-rich copper-binding protein CopC